MCQHLFVLLLHRSWFTGNVEKPCFNFTGNVEKPCFNFTGNVINISAGYHSRYNDSKRKIHGWLLNWNRYLTDGDSKSPINQIQVNMCICSQIVCEFTLFSTFLHIRAQAFSICAVSTIVVYFKYKWYIIFVSKLYNCKNYDMLAIC